MEVVPKRSKGSNAGIIRLVEVVVIVLVLCGLSFYGGYAYEKHHAKNQQSSTPVNGVGSRFGRGGSFGGGQQGSRAIGAVTAISSTSITITNSQSNTSQTFSITSSTVITDSGQTVTASDIQTGETVFITTSSSTSSQAERILVNPSFGGGFGGQNGSSPSTQSEQSD